MNYKFFQNTACEYYPCHKAPKADDFNCMFCYCPLYLLESKCGGNFVMLPSGVKDCSNCTIIHHKEKGYEFVMDSLTKKVFKKSE